MHESNTLTQLDGEITSQLSLWDYMGRLRLVADRVVKGRRRKQIRGWTVEHLEHHRQPQRQVRIQVTVHEPHAYKKKNHRDI
jgi:hypothetical protein